MSLFASIQNSANALSVADLGLQVVGNNVANANTPGYIRQELLQTSGPGIRVGGVLLGYGVRAVGVVQKVDRFVTERLRETSSDLAASSTLSEVYDQLENVFGELSDNDLSTRISDFSNSIHDLLNQPGNPSLRRLVIERAKTLASELNSVKRQMGTITQELDQQVYGAAGEINRLTDRLAALNRRIVELEGGRTLGSDAVGLRDERYQILQELSTVVDIRSVEQQSGAVTVFVGGEYLVSDGIQRKVTIGQQTIDGIASPEIRLVDTDSPLQVSAGNLKGIYDARHKTIGAKIKEIDAFAVSLIQQFNGIHSQGQGLDAYSTLEGTYSADDISAPLDLAGLFGDVVNGSFDIQVLDLQTGINKTSNIRIRLLGGTDDTTLENVRDQISGISGLTAAISSDGKLRIAGNSAKIRFAFGEDTSGFLAAAGVNTFFTGTSSDTIAVNQKIIDDQRYFAASLNGVGGGTDNALRLAEAFDAPLAKLDGQSIKQLYENLVVSTTQDVNIQNGITDGLRNFYKVLEGTHLSISGVNMDEEAVKMIFYQRVFQASSRVIQASNEMLDVLVKL